MELKSFTYDEYLNLPNNEYEIYKRNGIIKPGDIFARVEWKDYSKGHQYVLYAEIYDMEIVEDSDARIYKDIKNKFKMGKIYGSEEFVF